MDKVSIIMPAFNSEKFISESIDSVINQTYKNWELIIVDNGSSDNTLNIIKIYQDKDHRIKSFFFIENNGAGPSRARNKAIELSKGRYIAQLDSDDIWRKIFLEKMIHFISKNNYSLISSSYFLMDEDGKIISEFIAPKKVSYNDLLKKNTIGCLTAIYDTQKLDRLYFPIELKKFEDVGLWLKILSKVKFAYAIQEPLAYYRVRTTAISYNKFKSFTYQWYIYRVYLKFPILKSLYYTCFYTFNGLKKHYVNYYYYYLFKNSSFKNNSNPSSKL